MHLAEPIDFFDGGRISKAELVWADAHDGTCMSC